MIELSRPLPAERWAWGVDDLPQEASESRVKTDDPGEGRTAER